MAPMESGSWFAQSAEWIVTSVIVIMSGLLTWIAKTNAGLRAQNDANADRIADHETRLQVSAAHRDHVKESVDEIKTSIAQIHKRITSTDKANDAAHETLNTKLDTIIQNGGK